jgi:hypothetical protein
MLTRYGDTVISSRMRSTKGTVRLSMNYSERLHKLLRRHAIEENRSMTQILEAALEAWCAAHPIPGKKPRGTP